jgi:hypothetical protein
MRATTHARKPNDMRPPTVETQVIEALYRASVHDRQLALSAGARPLPDRSFAGVQHTTMDESSWIDFVPGWLSSPETLFEEIGRSAAWEHRERKIYNQVFREPRFTAEYRELANAPIDGLREVAARCRIVTGRSTTASG